MPAVSVVFSALRRVKTWLCSTNTQVCFKWCILLYVHKNKTDDLPLLSIANEVISRNPVAYAFWTIQTIIIITIIIIYGSLAKIRG